MNQPHQNSESAPTTTLKPTDDQQAFIDRMRQAFETTATNSHRLTELYESGDIQALSTAIEDLAYDIAENDRDYIEANTRMKECRDSRRTQGEKEQMAIIQTIINKYKELIICETGLPDEARFGEIEATKLKVNQLLDSVPPEQIPTAIDALKVLGIIDQTDDATTYVFPADLVPDSVNEKWAIYLASVCKHVRLREEMATNPDVRAATASADNARKYAHNAVTTDVHAILGFAQRYDWEFIDTRNLLGHIRDDTFPSHDSTHGPEADRLIDEHRQGIAISAVLSTQRSGH